MNSSGESCKYKLEGYRKTRKGDRGGRGGIHVDGSVFILLLFILGHPNSQNVSFPIALHLERLGQSVG